MFGCTEVSSKQFKTDAAVYQAFHGRTTTNRQRKGARDAKWKEIKAKLKTAVKRNLAILLITLANLAGLA